MNTDGCQAITIGKVTSFDPFHAIDEDGVMTLGAMCRELAEYGVFAYGSHIRTCPVHLPTLINEAEGDWEGDMVAVRRLFAPTVDMHVARRLYKTATK